MNDDEFRWKLASDSVHLVLWWAACISLHSNRRYRSALTRVSGRKNRNNQVILADVCSLSKEGLLDCGSSRGRTETVFLYECRDDVTTHLKNCFLSLANLKEYEVILQSAGLDRLSHEEVKTLPVCARHRHGMGKYWRPSKLCQYSGHKGPPTSVKSRDVINPTMAKEVSQLFDISVPIGSRKNKTHNFWRISLS